MSNQQPSSITVWIQKLHEGNTEAAYKLWDRCFAELVEKAKRFQKGRKQGLNSDEELAADAFHKLLKGVDEGRFNQLESTDDLWKLLTHFLSRKSIDSLRYEQRQKRGDGKLRGESVFGDKSGLGIEQHADAASEPFQQVEFDDELNHLLGLLKRDDLKQVVMLRLEGFTNLQIADSLSISEASVSRKVKLIKKTWNTAIAEA